MTNGAEERLARVTYLPGVQPPTSAPLVSASAPVVPSPASSALPVSSASPVSSALPAESALSAASDPRVPLEAIPGLLKASALSPRPDDLPGKRFAGHTGEIQRLEPTDLRMPAGVERSSRAHNVSLNALARRGLSTAEMASLLARRDLDGSAVDAEVTRLQEVGLLDDAELARTLVRTLRDRKGLGTAAISAELRRRKIDSQVIVEALEEADSANDADDLTRARELAARRAPQLRSLDPETARRRLGAFLMRKGYSGSIVASAVASALAPNHPAVRSSNVGRPNGEGPRFR